MVLAVSACSSAPKQTDESPGKNTTLALGAQFRTFHVYVQPGTDTAFVKSWVGTFGGSAQPPMTTDLTPYPSTAAATMVSSPVAALSVYDFKSGVPYPFGQEDSGWGVSDVDAGVQDATASGADVLVAPFNDPLGRDAVIRFPGGNSVQLWHLFNNPDALYPPFAEQPDLRIYVPETSMQKFLGSYLKFTNGHIVSDDKTADGAQIGLNGKKYHRIIADSNYGSTVVIGTDGQLPFPFGREASGITVKDLTPVLAKAKKNDASVLWGPYTAPDGHSAVVQFPGGFITEIHDGQIH